MLLRGRIDLFDVNEINQMIINCKYRVVKNGVEFPLCKKNKVQCRDGIDNGQCLTIKEYMEHKYDKGKDRVVLDSWGMGVYDK